MKRYTNEVLSVTTGLSVIGATVAVFVTGTDVLAALYLDDDVTSEQKLNPFASGFIGEFSFYVADGSYDFRVTRAGRVTWLRDVEIYDLDSLTNDVIRAFPGEASKTLPPVAQYAGKAIGADALGNLIGINIGDGMDPSLRSDLADPGTGLALAGFRRVATGSVTTSGKAELESAPYRPEQFGAVGDGVADDAPAIQRALNAIMATARPGTLRLTQNKKYRCNSQLLFNAQYVNITGTAMLDFSGWVGAYIRITGTLTEFSGSYGYNGAISGQIIIKGAGESTASTGILFDSDIAGTNTHMMVQTLTIISCGTGIALGGRAYNTELYNVKILACAVCVDWLASGEDANERFSVFGGTFFNGGIGFRNNRAAGAMYIYTASIDYMQKALICINGKIQTWGCHYESNRFIDSPFEARGVYALIELFGGWLLCQENEGGLRYTVTVENTCAVIFKDVITNNMFKALAVGSEPVTWAQGAGRFEIHGLRLNSEFAGHPMRVMTTGSRLVDGDFDDAALGADTIFRLTDTSKIIDRYGLVIAEGQGAPNITVERATANMFNGTGCLRVNKAYGTTSVGELCLMMLPVERGGKSMAGLKVRLAPDRPGTNGQIAVGMYWVKSDGTDGFGVPIINKRILATEFPEVLTPSTTAYQEVQPWNGAASVTAPKWATHCIVAVDFVQAFQASFLFDRLHMDVF